MDETFRSATPQTGPAWLRGRVALRIRGAIATALDHAFDALKQAVRARFVQTAPPDALSDLGDERHIAQYPGDTVDTYRARVLAAWDLWQQGGSAAAIVAALTSMGFTSVRVYAANGPGPAGEAVWPPDGDTSNWSRFWVLIDLTGANANPFGWQRVRYGDGHAWGGGWTWGSTATRDEVRLIRGVIRLWKAAHEIHAGTFVDLPGGSRRRWRGQL